MESICKLKCLLPRLVGKDIACRNEFISLKPKLTSTTSNMSSRMLSVDFEVFGRVQGVFFRKSTQRQATALGIRGWCMNTDAGTVKGSMQGSADRIEEMKDWLKYKGSPQSRIDKATFTNEKEIQSYTYDSFAIKK